MRPNLEPTPISRRVAVPTLALIFSLSSPVAALAKKMPAADPSPVEEAPVPIRIIVDVALDENTVFFQEKLSKYLREELESKGHTTTEDIELAEVTLRLRARYFDDDPDNLNFVIDTDIQVGNRAYTLESAHCAACVDDHFFVRVKEHTQDVLLDAVDTAVAEALEVRNAGPSGPDGPGPNGSGPNDPPPPRIGALGYTGIGALGLGLALGIGGAVELSRGADIEPSDNELARQVDHAPAGKVLLGVGGGLFVAGVIMLGVDLARRAKKESKRDRASLPLLLPSVGPTSVGLTLIGRF